MTESPFYLRVLRNALAERQERNPRYSIRAFAASLAIDSGACSQFLSGKRTPSLTVAERLIDRLGLDVLEREAFLQSIGRRKIEKGLRRVNPNLRALAVAPTDPDRKIRKDLSLEAFQAVSRWYYYAILELVKLPEFDESPAWISKTLGIPEREAALALERLVALEMLERVEGRLSKTHESFYSADPQLTTTAHQRRQLEILGKSAQALERIPIAVRNHSAMTVAIDPARIPAAKKKISAFLQELSDFLESGGPKRVYEMQLSLFPLQVDPSSSGANP